MPFPRLPTTALFLLLLFPWFALSQESTPEDQAKSILRAIERASAEEAYLASEKLSDLGDEILLVLNEAQKSPHPTVRFAAARSHLSLIGDGKAGEVLFALVANEGDLRLRELATDALADEFASESAKPLKDLLTEPLPGRLKARVARAVYALDPEHRSTARDVLRDLMSSLDLLTQESAAFALAEIGLVTAAAPVLRRLESSPSERGRLAALYLQADRWKTLALEKARARTDDAPSPLRDFDVLQEVLQRIHEIHQVGDQFEREELLTAAARGMLEALDPYSTLFSADDLTEWEFELDPSYGGIGAYVNTNEAKEIFIVRPIYSGPAYKSELQSGDVILRVDGWDAIGRTLDEVTKRMKGPRGSPVTLTIGRRGWTKTREFTIEREIIRIPTVNYDLLPGDVGYAQLTTFGNSTAQELESALLDLEARGMKALILDLRYNSGGFLSAAQEIAGKFLDGRQMVCYWEGRNSKEAPRQELYTRNPGTSRSVPLVVLVNRFSASASEIVAGALQDHKRAVLIGERTVGKGSVQRFYPLSSRPSEPFTDQPRMNGVYDLGERYQDVNENGHWDDGEPFEDRLRLNQSYDPGEPFTDANSNGTYDRGEDFVDANKNGVYDGPEPFVDANKNGVYDRGPEIKLTIARYYLPSGRSIHAERDKKGKVLKKGGVLPDELISLPAIEGWKQEERTRLREGGRIRDYVRDLLNQSKDRLLLLAASDGKRIDAYPNFEALYTSLTTSLTQEDVRALLRMEIRRVASDLRGREFVADVTEDPQILRAVYRALQSLGTDLESIPSLAPLKSVLPEPEVEKEQ
ncbi:MAG TPA: S41 family peptidase [Planctomycetota bacterium]|nr:S41 family peptidase [Planctomycetota bacterium]